MSEKLKEYAPAVTRVGVSLVFLWFGVSQLLNPADWTGWLPSYVKIIPLSSEILVLLNGIFETVFGVFLLVGFYTRISAVLLALHMAHIVTVVGYGEIGVRDFGILAGALFPALYGSDKFSLDYLFSKKKEEGVL